MRKSTATDSRLLGTAEVAKCLGVNASRVRQLCLAGRLPATKLGRDWYVSPADLRLVRDRRRTGRPKKKSA